MTRDPRWLADALGVQVNDMIEMVRRVRITHILDNGDVQVNGVLLHELNPISVVKVWPRLKVGETSTAERCEELPVGSVVRLAAPGTSTLANATALKTADQTWNSSDDNRGPLSADYEYKVLWIEPTDG